MVFRVQPDYETTECGMDGLGFSETTKTVVAKIVREDDVDRVF